MPIRITCTQCTTSFQVDSELAGQHISCPNCFKRLFVEPPTFDQPGYSDSSAEEDYRLSPIEDDPPRQVVDNATAPADGHSVPISVQPVGDDLHFAPDESNDSSREAPSSETNCSNCGTALSAGQEHCHKCFFHSGLNRVVNTIDPDDSLANEYGFRRYLLEKLQKDQSPESVFFLLDALLVLAVLFLVVIRSRLTFFIVPLAIVYVVYRVVVRTARLWYSGRSLLWRFVLLLGRSLSWRKLNGKERITSTIRQATFSDRELSQLNGLDELQVLDLQGTAVTDAGLANLKHLHNLRFLVLRKTGVTEDGVWELQQTIPRTCIWY